VAEHVDAAEGLALAAPLVGRRLLRARVGGTAALLLFPVIADLLEAVLEGGERRASGAFAGRPYWRSALFTVSA
jgi:hypothetical protein